MTEDPIHPNEPQAIAVGVTAPDFTLPHWDGAAHQLTTALAAAPVVLVFYRGDW